MRVMRALAVVVGAALLVGGCGGSSGGGEDEAKLKTGSVWVAEVKPARVKVREYQDGGKTQELHNPDLNGTPLTFLVDGKKIEQDWVKVHLPVRPNGSTGWVRAADVRLASNDYKVEIDLEDRELRLVRQGDVEWETPIGVGTRKTPTPTGEFFLTELIMPKDEDTVYGTFALGLSGYTDSPGAADYKGGEGGLAIHGTNDPDSIGERISHGCIRVPNDVIDHMASTLPMGTPVEIS